MIRFSVPLQQVPFYPPNVSFVGERLKGLSCRRALDPKHGDRPHEVATRRSEQSRDLPEPVLRGWKQRGNAQNVFRSGLSLSDSFIDRLEHGFILLHGMIVGLNQLPRLRHAYSRTLSNLQLT